MYWNKSVLSSHSSSARYVPVMIGNNNSVLLLSLHYTFYQLQSKNIYSKLGEPETLFGLEEKCYRTYNLFIFLATIFLKYTKKTQIFGSYTNRSETCPYQTNFSQNWKMCVNKRSIIIWLFPVIWLRSNWVNWSSKRWEIFLDND